jgi:uncharacterized protein (TIGR01777 family)
MAKIVIAGGSGMIGQKIEKLLLEKNHEVFILTRNAKNSNHIQWDLQNQTIETEKIKNTDYLINLCGENIGDSRWTAKRKKALHDSRIGTNTFLFDKFDKISSLKRFISASGINCYPFDSSTKVYSEKDAFGKDYLSQLVEKWEESADLFSTIVPVCKIRISMVLDKNQGALQKLLPLAKLGILSPMGKGKQRMSWVHIDDVASAFVFAIENEISGSYNLTGKAVSNIEFTKSLLRSHGKSLIFPKVPAFLLKMILGEQSSIVLDGVECDNSKLKKQGFHYKYETLDKAFVDLFGK